MSLTTHSANDAGSALPVREPGNAGRESLYHRLRRIGLGVMWALKPPRLWSLPAIIYLLARHYIAVSTGKDTLPRPENAFPGGVAGICPNLEVDTLLAGYARGLFPFSHVGPRKWMAPKERIVLFFENFKMEKNLRRRLRNNHFRVTFDQDFEGVMRGCAELRPGRLPLTWISPSIISAYTDLFKAGHAHSVEVWDGEGNLVGGVYGVAIGRVFYTESQFNRVRDAAKVGFAVLNCHLQSWGFVLNDGKVHTDHLEHVGFHVIPRQEFCAILEQHAVIGAEPPRQPARPGGHWQVDEDLDVGNWRPDAQSD